MILHLKYTMNLESCLLVLLIGTTTVAGDVCSVKSYYRTQSEIVASSGGSVVFPCSRAYSGRYLSSYSILWALFNISSFDAILDHKYVDIVHYYHGYSESQHRYNTTDSSLTVHNITLLDAGCYRCGQSSSTNVYDRFIITTGSDPGLSCLGLPYRHMTERNVSEGERVVLQCPLNTSGYVYEQYIYRIYVYWYKDTQTILVHTLGSMSIRWDNGYNAADFIFNTTDLSLTIPHMTSRYNACYRCRQSISYNTIRDTVRLTVRASALTMFGAPAVGELIDEGTTIVVECVTDEGNPTPQITWTKDGSDLLNPESETIQNLETAGAYNATKMKSILTIEVTRSHNDKQYSCISESVSKMFTLSIRFVATSLTISGAPEVGDWIDEGTTVVVECVTDESNPTAEVTWTRGEANLDPLTELVENFEVAGRYNSNIRRSVLTIQVRRTHHNKQFSCSTSGTSTSNFFTLAVRYGNHTILLESLPSSLDPIAEISIINFTCTIDVNPPPNLALWTRGKVEKIQEQRETMSLTLSLNITHIYNKVGIFCEAVGGDLENALSSNEIQFDVMFEPTTLNLTSSHLGLIDEGQQVNLTCESAEGNPTPDITWTRNGESIHTTPNLENIYNGQYNAKYCRSILTLTAYRSIDNSQYMCKVGSLYSVYQLQVTWPTEPAHSITIEEFSSHTAKVSWISGNSGGSQQTFLVQFKTLEESAYINSPFIEDTGFGSKNYYVMSGLEANAVYSIKVISINNYKSQAHRVESNVLTFKTNQSNTVSRESELEEVSPGNNMGLIAGTLSAGVVIILLGAVIGIVLWCRCRILKADRANKVTEDCQYYNNAAFNANPGKSLEPGQYEELDLHLPSITHNVTPAEESTMPDTEQYVSITQYELPEPPSQYTILEGHKREKNTQSDIYDDVDNSPPDAMA